MGILLLRSSVVAGGGSGDTVTINGSGFGSKTTVAPFFFQPFTTTTQADDYLAAGWDFIISNGQGSSSLNFVNMDADGPFSGMGYWRQDVPLNEEAIQVEWFPHIGKLISGGALGVYTSYYVRIQRIAGVGGDFCQLKGPRVGCSTDSDPVIQYNTAPRYASQYSVSTLVGAGAERNRTRPGAEYDSGGGLIQTTNETDPSQALTDGNWNHIEVYHRLNAVGSSDGIQVVRLNGFTFHHITDRNIRSSSDQRLRFIQPTPGLANDYGDPGNQWICDIGAVLIDTIDDAEQYYAAVWLGNASTRAACTKKLMLSASSWSDTQIVASAGISVPAEFTHAYVDTTTGDWNDNGLSFDLS